MRPPDDEQRVFLSSPAGFVGELEVENFFVAYAFRRSLQRRVIVDENPYTRYALTICFRTLPAAEIVGRNLPDYSYAGEVLCDYLSVLYGKRFDSHGSIQNHGTFYVPELSTWSSYINRSLPFSSNEPRKDFPIRMNLEEIRRLLPLIFAEDAHSSFIRTFKAAAKFYRLALVNVETDVEIAFLQLITAGEIISSELYNSSHFIDDEVEEILAEIKQKLCGGVRKEEFLRRKFYSLRKKFTLMATEHCVGSFFDVLEPERAFLCFSVENFERAIKSAYDVRSKYVHTGISFGEWLMPRRILSEDVTFGEPNIEDTEFKKTLAASATFIGLERVIRFCIIKFAVANGLNAFL